MDGTISPQNFAKLLEIRALNHPDKQAFIFLPKGEEEEEILSYGELDRRARQVAIRLREVTRPGDRVLLVFPPGLDFVIGIFACLYSGVTAVPIFPPQPGKLKSTLKLFENTARDAQTRVILCDQLVYSKRSLLSLMAKGVRGFQWINVSKLTSQKIDGFEIHPNRASDLAFILYTSGSTGDPNGVMLTHQNILANFQGFTKMVEMTGLDPTQEKGVCWLPPYHVAGLFFGILLPIYFGGTSVLLSPLDFLSKPVRWLRAISRYRAVLTGAPNFAYDYCVDQIPPEERVGLDLSHWRHAFNGSEGVRPATLKRFSEAFKAYGFDSKVFHAVYGLTETGNIVSLNFPGNRPLCLSFSKESLSQHKVQELTPENPEGQTLLSNGRVFDNFEIKIVDPETRLPRPPDYIGEIWLRGPCVASGYWNKGGLNERIFGARLAQTGEGPFFRTGDLGFVHKGELFISGRLKEMIIIRGKNYFPADLENSIVASNPNLEGQAIAIFSIEADNEEQLIVAAECEKLHEERYQRIFDRIRETLSKDFSLQPQTIVLTKVGTLPRTSTLKTQRRASRDQFLADKLKILAQWNRGKRGPIAAPKEHRDLISLPQNDQELEEFLIKKFSSVLGLKPGQLNLMQSLPSYGLDSLEAVELSQFLETHLKIRLGIGLLFEAKNITSIFSEIREQWYRIQTEGISALESLDLLKESTLPPTLIFDRPQADANHLPIFLTGATGFLGAFLLERLLKETSSEIFCLVRGKDPEDGARRIRENLEYFSLWNPDFAPRIRPVLGDLGKPSLGLGENGFEELAGKIGSIYHCGANVNFIFSYWDLKPINVTGTLEMIRLAGTQTTKEFHYISTVGIFPIWGSANGKSFKEEDAPTLWEGHFSGYALTKWVAERLVFQARERGLPATVFRVGEVIGHSETGICKPDKDAYSNLLKGALLMGEVPRLNLNIYFAPVDMVAKGVVFLASKKDSLGKTFHLFLDSIDGISLVELINSWQHKLGIKPFPEFLRNIEDLNEDLPHNPLAPFMPLIRSPIIHELSQKKSLLKLDSKNTLKELKKASIPTPPVRQAVKTYINYLQKTGFLD